MLRTRDVRPGGTHPLDRDIIDMFEIAKYVQISALFVAAVLGVGHVIGYFFSGKQGES